MNNAIKGPWCVIRCDDENSMNMLAISMEERPDYHLGDYSDERRINPARIAAIVYHQSTPAVCPEDDEGAEARAHLIAAAPDLLSSLQEIFDYSGGADHALLDEYVINRALAAIAKATGEHR